MRCTGRPSKKRLVKYVHYTVCKFTRLCTPKLPHVNHQTSNSKGGETGRTGRRGGRTGEATTKPTETPPQLHTYRYNDLPIQHSHPAIDLPTCILIDRQSKYPLLTVQYCSIHCHVPLGDEHFLLFVYLYDVDTPPLPTT